MPNSVSYQYIRFYGVIQLLVDKTILELSAIYDVDWLKLGHEFRLEKQHLESIVHIQLEALEDKSSHYEKHAIESGSHSIFDQ